MEVPRLARKGRKALVSSRGFVPVATSRNLLDYFSQIIPFPFDGGKSCFEGYFSLEVRGNSLVEAGINDGDFLLLRKAEAPEDGAIMLILYEGQNTVKKVKIHENRVFFCWADR